MALRSSSLLLFGYPIEVANQYIDFRAVNAGPQLTAVIPQGTYSLSDLLSLISAAMGAADGTNTYTVTADRTIAGGTQNRVTIATSGAYLDILFGSGTHAAASCAATIGFNNSDYTGATTYNGASSTGSSILTTYPGYNWVAPTRNRTLFGKVNISASGVKEAIVFQLQQFFKVEFRFESESRVDALWQAFFDWAAQQRDIEFTPEVTSPTVFYNCTLESTEEAQDGLGWEMKEMLPEYPFLYQTGELRFRVVLVAQEFINPI